MTDLSVLVIGAGSIGERHARCFLQAAIKRVSICEPREQRRSELKESYPFEALYGSFDEAPLQEIDAVVVCVPAHLHVPLATRALEAGCHVLCEKPLAITMQDADHLLEVAAKSDRVAGVAYVYRSIPACIRIREHIRSGIIGPVRQVTLVSGQEFPKFRPDYREIYYKSHASGGGAIQDALSHMVNFVQWCIGLEEYVYASADHLVLEGVEVEDTASVFLRTPDKYQASFTINQFQKNNENYFKFVGEEGTLVYDIDGWKVGLFKDDEWSWEEFPIERDDMYIAQAKNFIAAIEGREPVKCTLEDGYETLRTIQTALQCVQVKHEIKVR